MKKTMFFVILAACFMNMAFSGTLTLLTPNGGELCRGQAYNITWTATDFPARTLVKLVLFQGDAKIGTIAQDLDAGGSPYRWKVGRHDTGTAALGGNYRIRLRTMDNAVQDFDNTPFSIAECPPLALAPTSRTLSTRPFTGSRTTVRVTSPNGGERLTIGERTTITWEHAHARPGQNLNVSLVSSPGRCRNEAAAHVYHLGGIPVENGTFRWEISPTIRYDRFNVIRLSPAVAEDFTPDESDFCFQINYPDTTVRILSPNGGESFERGASIPIRWEVTNPKSWQRVRIWAIGWDPACGHTSTELGSHMLGTFSIDRREILSGYPEPRSWTFRPGRYRIDIQVEADVPSTPGYHGICYDRSDGCFTIRE